MPAFHRDGQAGKTTEKTLSGASLGSRRTAAGVLGWSPQAAGSVRMESHAPNGTCAPSDKL
jgi:hypothetical protein